mmetsp:Transcript_692/g.2563  ORF Transcript_692/g.2563 Transcript_692/m.2563 type:complete len:244 (+) Transcript_692:536-1267(+)
MPVAASTKLSSSTVKPTMVFVASPLIITWKLAAAASPALITLLTTTGTPWVSVTSNWKDEIAISRLTNTCTCPSSSTGESSNELSPSDGAGGGNCMSSSGLQNTLVSMASPSWLLLSSTSDRHSCWPSRTGDTVSRTSVWMGKPSTGSMGCSACTPNTMPLPSINDMLTCSASPPFARRIVIGVPVLPSVRARLKLSKGCATCTCTWTSPADPTGVSPTRVTCAKHGVGAATKSQPRTTATKG